jgi:hypothetical protein
VNINITSGDMSGELIAESGVPGEVFVWHDVLYDGPRSYGSHGVPTNKIMHDRAAYLSELTGGGLKEESIFNGLSRDYAKLSELDSYDEIVFWFDSCLFDLSMLAHLLACIPDNILHKCKLICVSEFEDIKPFNGLGQLDADQMKSLYPLRKQLNQDQIYFSRLVDMAFANQDVDLFEKIINYKNPPLKYFDRAVQRWLEEKPTGDLSVGKLERLILDALDNGCGQPGEIFGYVAQHDSTPQYWGDITLWQKINGLSDRGLVEIKGPAAKLPQWFESEYKLSDFDIVSSK